jgi:MtN3 and saliva related transmembrane protein
VDSVDIIGHDTLGLLAGALTTIAFVPQVVRIVKTRSARDISWGMFGIFSVGIVLWLWYGVRLASLPLIAANVVTLLLALVILLLKWRFGQTEGSHEARDDPRAGSRQDGGHGVRAMANVSATHVKEQR